MTHPDRPECIDCPQANEPVCCHTTIATDTANHNNNNNNQRADNRLPKKTLWGVLVAQPWEQE